MIKLGSNVKSKIHDDLTGHVVVYQPLNKHDILCATENYLSMCSDETNKYCTWGDGDSLDRERVRDILLEEYNYKYVEE